jgi:hypothetical protein
MASNFVDTRAPTFHSAFSTAATLNADTLEYEPPEVVDVKETLECYQQRAGRLVDFTNDLAACRWDDVLEQLGKAQEAAEKSNRMGKNPVKRAWRAVGKASTILEPGLDAIPDDLCVLHGGLAVIFSVSPSSSTRRPQGTS